eukprot:TRINITY_DN37471_c0_g1_i1.p1 TRINITY_DN37471_c0_g1~~TRINITY_DN37471_c0_g1_i1.p1  ORF type:complete len:327 (+),score=93.70 TRINITY_DN37471_c0_g1_i1:97-981(+)
MEQRQLIPPINFELIMPGVYRSGCPTKHNYEFLRRLRLRTILYVGTERLPEEREFFLRERICDEMHVIGIEGNREPFITVPAHDLSEALSVALDRRKHPLLLHSMRGRHREGVVVGCLRRLQGWSLVSVFEEYDRHCGRYCAKAIDKRCIEFFRPSIPINAMHLPEGWDTSVMPSAYVTRDSAAVAATQRSATALSTPAAVSAPAAVQTRASSPSGVPATASSDGVFSPLKADAVQVGMEARIVHPEQRGQQRWCTVKKVKEEKITVNFHDEALGELKVLKSWWDAESHAVVRR